MYIYSNINFRKLDADRLFPSWVRYLEPDQKEAGKVLCLELAGAGAGQYARYVLCTRKLRYGFIMWWPL